MIAEPMSVVNARSAAPAAIEVRGLVKRYGDRTVLDGVDLRVAPGELVALLGPNGAGKTTLVEIVEGYRAADGGEVRVLGERPDAGTALRARVGLMLQSGGLDPRATPRDVLRLYATFHAGSRDPEGLLADLGLSAVATTRVRRLSGGERQRLAFALALVGEPEVLLLDEPTAGMDPEARRATRDRIAGLRAEGRAILLTTHDLVDVERLADRVAILHGGRIRAEGTPDELMAGASAELRFRLHGEATDEQLGRLGARLATAAPAAAVSRADGASGGALAWYRVTGEAATADTIAEVAGWAAREGVLIVELRAGAASLEERYLELTGDAAVEAAE
ncbi:MAG TPA: ABC transporter ATP-binding protein [Candidatus Limnocylindrales bacterium]|nr:ABC transporter ATP-binding protein [Candidatus Limnocylindrales bacterium]